MAAATETYPNASSSASASMRRKDRRKVAKKEKRKQKRKEVAELERLEEEAQLNNPEEQRRIQLEMEMEKEKSEKERREFEERERIFLEELARNKAEEEEERIRALEEELKENQSGLNAESNESDEWEYVDDGPPEIIWQGNEIIVKKNRVKVKKSTHQEITTENPNRPTSNPLPPQSEAYTDYKNASVLTAQQLLENVAQQTPNFGTEQDKAHCPFHLKTGACRFGSRCSRVHFYPDKSCTLLMKNMYNGPGLAWEQDEGLEYTDEEVERSYEEFYEDVHTEFLKFGEIINFKVCRNGSYHLRGNVYVHYKFVDSALLAYQIFNGRYFAGKQVSCEFVSVTRWRVAICGDYMKSRLKTCSRGTACNFIHSFRNPCGDYEWADWDKPPPRFWVEKMVALFGYSDDFIYDTQSEDDTVGTHRNSRKRHHRKRSRSKEFYNSKRRSREHYEEDNTPRIKYHQNEDKKRTWDLVHKLDEVKSRFGCHENSKKRDYHHDECDNYDDEFSEKASSGKRSVSIDSDRYRWRRSNGSDSNTDLSDGITTKINHLETSSSHRKKKVHGTKMPSEVEFLNEHLKSSYKKYDERSKSYDSSDFSCDSSGLEFEKNLDETETGDRWVPDKIDTRKHAKDLRRSDRSYKKQKNKDHGSQESSDALIKDSGRSRGRTNSKESHETEKKLKKKGRKYHSSDKVEESNKSGSHDTSFESSDARFKEGRSRSNSSKSREG